MGRVSTPYGSFCLNNQRKPAILGGHFCRRTLMLMQFQGFNRLASMRFKENAEIMSSQCSSALPHPNVRCIHKVISSSPPTTPRRCRRPDPGRGPSGPGAAAAGAESAKQPPRPGSLGGEGVGALQQTWKTRKLDVSLHRIFDGLSGDFRPCTAGFRKQG